jgi:DNA-binding NarL/FixJ family response regulator
VARVAEPDEAPAVIRALAPDAVLVDVLAGSPEPVDRILRSCPQAKLVALGVPDRPDEVLAYAEAGVAEYVTLDASLAEVTDVLASAGRGEVLCSPLIAGALFRRVSALTASQSPAHGALLTERELQILELVELGRSNKAIALELRIEVATVKNHIHNILGKLQVPGRGEAAAQFRRGHLTPRT